MRTLLYSAMAAAVIALCATSCGRSVDDRGVEFRVAEHGSAFRLLNSASEFGIGEDVVVADSVSFILPSHIYGADINPLLDSIMSLAFDSVGADFDAVMRGHVLSTAGQLGYAVEPVDTNAADGFNTIVGSVVNMTPELLVYSVRTDEYKPRAANGMSTEYYINYDMARGRVLTFDSLFEPSRQQDLVAAIQSQADAIEQVIGPTTITELPYRSNFMLSPSGEIVFVYQPMEVASHAQSFIRIPFYTYELAEYMTPFAKEYFKLNDL